MSKKQTNIFKNFISTFCRMCDQCLHSISEKLKPNPPFVVTDNDEVLYSNNEYIELHSDTNNSPKMKTYKIDKNNKLVLIEDSFSVEEKYNSHDITMSTNTFIKNRTSYYDML